MERKTIVITGATSGIGYHTALAFAASGANVFGVGRDPKRCLDAERSIREQFPEVTVKYFIADLSRQSQVRLLAGAITDDLKSSHISYIDVLVNNAGTFSDRLTKTEDGVEMTLAVNHLAPFLLTHELLPLLNAAPHGKVINVSSDSHYRTWIDFNRLNNPLLYVSLWAYKVSKLANVLFSAEFNRRANGSRVRAYAVDPGLVNTNIGLKGTSGLSRLVWKFRQMSGTSPDAPAKTIIHLSKDHIENGDELYWYNSRPKKPSGQARNPENSRRLWNISNKLCHTEWN